MTQDETNIEKNELKLFNSKMKQLKVGIFGSEKPSIFTQILFYYGTLISFIFGLWSVISLAILKFPNYLKQHKNVDVEAIIELRGRELGFIDDSFYANLENYHFYSCIIWLICFICFFLLWRKIYWASYIIVSGILVYYTLMLVKLGSTYYVDDTTLFDKTTLLLLFVATIVHALIFRTSEKSTNPIKTEN
jgi:hypothetical protein